MIHIFQLCNSILLRDHWLVLPGFYVLHQGQPFLLILRWENLQIFPRLHHRAISEMLSWTYPVNYDRRDAETQRKFIILSRCGIFALLRLRLFILFLQHQRVRRFVYPSYPQKLSAPPRLCGYSYFISSISFFKSSLISLHGSRLNCISPFRSL